MSEGFIYFTYEEYDRLINIMLYNVWKNTYISKEDLKQNLFIFLFNLENKVKNKKNILNIKGYVVHCLKQKIRNVAKDYFKKITDKVNIDINDIEDYLISDNNIENYIINKIYIENLFEYYNISEEDKKLLLYKRDNSFRNERYLINRKLKNKVTKTEKEKWGV